jgi:hypothetical protein
VARRNEIFLSAPKYLPLQPGATSAYTGAMTAVLLQLTGENGSCMPSIGKR